MRMIEKALERHDISSGRINSNNITNQGPNDRFF